MKEEATAMPPAPRSAGVVHLEMPRRMVSRCTILDVADGAAEPLLLPLSAAELENEVGWYCWMLRGFSSLSWGGGLENGRYHDASVG